MPGKEIKQAFAGYLLHAPEPQPGELTQVGPGTAGGEYLRRFWHPVAFSSDLGDVPVRIRILGEDLVIFRDKSGQVGLLHLQCPHRNASLEFGIISDRGIRCCYHGWLFDVDGSILEMPGEPAGSDYKDKFCHGAYPTREFKGLVFAYFGPPDREPDFPLFDSLERPGTRLIPSGWTPGRKYVWPCNWVQVKENSMDPVHTFFLHTIASGAQFTPEFGIVPEIEYEQTPIGMVYIASRRVGDNVWVRLHDLIMPNIHQVASVLEDGRKERRFGAPYLTHWAVPIDDYSFMEIGWLHETDDMRYDQSTVDKLHFGMLDDRPYGERQRQPGDYDAQTSQGRLNNFDTEHLATSDQGVAMFRRLLREGIRSVKAGKDPMGAAPARGQSIHTYTQNAVVKAPKLDDPDAEKEQLRSIGRRVLAGEFRD
jgi:nitrite reductase/ring-hydroxylating ferredoxin subunit